MTRSRCVVSALVVIAACLTAAPAAADVGARLYAAPRGFAEVPAISTPGTGVFYGEVNTAGTALDFELEWSGLVGAVTQIHFHLAQPGVNGGIIVFLCSNLGNGPVGTPSCPTGAGAISGTRTAADVVGAASQGLAAGDFAALLRAVRAGVVYVNVHTASYPGGEIRGQLLYKAVD